MIKGSKGDVINAGQWNDTKCSVCGKNFIPTPDWVYKDSVCGVSGVRCVCSYGCLVDGRRKHEEAKRRRLTERRIRESGIKRPPVSTAKKVRCVSNGVVYASVSEAARETGAPPTGITRVCRKEKQSCKGMVFEYADKAP